MIIQIVGFNYKLLSITALVPSPCGSSTEF